MANNYHIYSYLQAHAHVHTDYYNPLWNKKMLTVVYSFMCLHSCCQGSDTNHFCKSRNLYWVRGIFIFGPEPDYSTVSA